MLYTQYLIKVGVILFLNKKWVMPDCNTELEKDISSKFNISPILSKVLVSRGITEDSQIKAFLYPEVSQFADPFLLSGMENAVSCIKTSIEKNEKIVVFGDYDVDGITATYILYDYLTSLGADVSYYIPSRGDEGYGLNKNAIESLSEKGTDLIITVDVGITAVCETAFAKDKCIDVVITDHHTPTDILPDAKAIINPKLSDHTYPNKDLAGVGVAFKLIYALSGCDSSVIEKYCEFVCIGTISDMVPLTGENRFIASYGLEKLSATENPGLCALMEVSGIEKNCVSSSGISFALAPRLNAAGRIGSADLSVELFLCKDYERAKEIAAKLDEGNKMRQTTEQQILINALEIIENDKLYNDNVIVVSGLGWHHGVIGIVASKITEKYYKPTMVISTDNDGTAKASGRSIPGFNLFDALTNASHCLDKYGGHELAAGFSLKESNIEIFRKSINEYAQTIITEDMMVPKIKIDAEISPHDITLKNAHELTILEPYGIGNRMPVFSLKNLAVQNVKIHKDGKHAFLSFKRPGGTITSPAFNMAEKMSDISYGDYLDLAGTIGLNNFRGIDNVQYITKDTKFSSSALFSIDNLRCIFVVIKEYISKSKNKISLSELSKNISERFNCHLSNTRLKKAIEVFADVSILEVSFSEDYVFVWQGERFNLKTDITQSKTYKEQNLII